MILFSGPFPWLRVSEHGKPPDQVGLRGCNLPFAKQRGSGLVCVATALRPRRAWRMLFLAGQMRVGNARVARLSKPFFGRAKSTSYSFRLSNQQSKMLNKPKSDNCTICFYYFLPQLCFALHFPLQPKRLSPGAREIFGRDFPSRMAGVAHCVSPRLCWKT